MRDLSLLERELDEWVGKKRAIADLTKVLENLNIMFKVEAYGILILAVKAHLRLEERMEEKYNEIKEELESSIERIDGIINKIPTTLQEADAIATEIEKESFIIRALREKLEAIRTLILVDDLFDK